MNNKMTQEVQIILTLTVNADKTKKEIQNFFFDMEQTYTRTASAKNRWEFSKIELVEIKEEAEIYANKGGR
jgi:hypothetical protein